VAREERERDRARPAHRRGARDGRCNRLRREQLPVAPRDLQRNRTVTDTYEPGSTFKLITVAGALSEQLVSPSTRFTLPYSLQVADRVIHDAEQRGTVNYSVAQILAHSSNIGAITLAEMLGRTRSRRGSRASASAHDRHRLPGREPGIVLPPDKWSGSTIGNVPIGQGIAVTPVQMAAAYAAIANRGVWSRPHLVDHVAGGGGRRSTGAGSSRRDRVGADAHG
jgi:cell division protein FtsI (penicillin-binding protein 3)/stage V sporulation protein D (sporulation-specific penicillin-binding protein)